MNTSKIIIEKKKESEKKAENMDIMSGTFQSPTCKDNGATYTAAALHLGESGFWVIEYCDQKGEYISIPQVIFEITGLALGNYSFRLGNEVCQLESY